MSAPLGSAFELQQLALRFAGAERAVFESLSLTVLSEEFLAIVGPSGCGKSTLLKLLAGLLSPTSGSIIQRCDEQRTSQRIGFVFQHPTLLPWRTANGNLQLPLELGQPNAKLSLTSADCDELLRQVGLSAADGNKRPAELSGGMQMRLSLARALATRPDVLLLDEPFAAVDDLLRLRLQEDVRRLHDEKKLTTILVTHNLHEAVFLADRVVVLGGSPSTVLETIACRDTQERNASYRESSSFYDSLKAVTAALFRTPLLSSGAAHA